MKFNKTLLFGSLLAAGTLAVGTHDADAAENYTVKAGDTLSKISKKYVGDDSLVEKIAKDNKLENVHLIFEGATLTIDTDNKAVETQEAAPVAQSPVVETTTPVEAAPVVEAAPAQAAPVQETAAAPATTSSAKEWIAQKESSGSYSATNGRYIGRYQLDASYLNGDYSEANQERVAEQYVTSRYGSWEGAQAFWMANGWY